MKSFCFFSQVRWCVMGIALLGWCFHQWKLLCNSPFSFYWMVSYLVSTMVWVQTPRKVEQLPRVPVRFSDACGAELWEKMTSKLTELDVLMQGIHPEVAQVKSKISLTTIQVAETTKATVKDKLKEFTLAFPSEHQIFLPNPPSETSLQEQFLVLAWFVTVMFVSLRLLTAMTKLAIKLCVSFPRRVLRITCRCCFRCLCPCERKGTQRV